MNILIVEADTAIREGVAEFLKENGAIQIVSTPKELTESILNQ